MGRLSPSLYFLIVLLTHMDIKERKKFGKVVLAPMAGFTSVGYRAFMKKFKVNFSYTEMVSDMGLIYRNEETISYLKTCKTDKPVGLQLFGHEVKNIIEAAKIALEINPNFDFIDINCACPVPKVTNTGAGSSLMKQPDLIYQIVKALKTEIKLPVSIKIRLGWDDNNINFEQVVRKACDAGVDFIAIHARTKKMGYTGKARYELLSGLKTKYNIPIIISGDIFSLDDAIRAIAITNADYVMVARGGIGHPWLIKQIYEYFRNGHRLKEPSLKQQKKWCLQLAKLLIKEKGEAKAIRCYRSIAPSFFSGFANSKQIRVKLSSSINTLNDLKTILKTIPNH